jgi:predicted NBD/HSP70 family sugar kinase
MITDEVIEYLGWGVSVVINILDPEIIVFSGSVFETDDNMLLTKIKNTAKKMLVDKGIRDVKFACSSSGIQNRIMGIGHLIYDELFNIAN